MDDYMDQWREWYLMDSRMQFAVNLLRATPLKSAEVLSPAILSLALTIIQQGSKGETRKNITKILLNGCSDKEFTEHQKLLQKSLQNAKNGSVLEFANKLFLDNRFPTKDEFTNEMKRNFGAESDSVNFADSTECIKIISDFMQNATKGKVVPQINEKTIRKSGAAIFSVLYAKTEWQEAFNPYFTQMENFTYGDGRTKKILFMNQQRKYLYFCNDKVQVLAKNYKDRDMQFLWILPRDPSAYVQLDEAGTVADPSFIFDVVRIKGGVKSSVRRLDPPTFHATHPYIFLMQKNDHPITIGQYTGPKE